MGSDDDPGVPGQKDPAHLTPLLEEDGLPRGSLWESCAIMQYLCNKHGLDQFYPTDPGERAMVDSAMFYLIGTLYPLLARATYPTLGFPQYPGEAATSDADDAIKAQAQQDAEAALAEPLDAYRAFFLDGKTFIGGDTPSIADIRLAATLEFLNAIDYPFPDWAKEYMAAVESTLGDAYSDAGRGRARLRRLRQVRLKRSKRNGSSTSGRRPFEHVVGERAAGGRRERDPEHAVARGEKEVVLAWEAVDHRQAVGQQRAAADPRDRGSSPSRSSGWSYQRPR